MNYSKGFRYQQVCNVSRCFICKPFQKYQITLKNPSRQRDFTSVFMKIKEFNKAKVDAKAQQPFEYVSFLSRGGALRPCVKRSY